MSYAHRARRLVVAARMALLTIPAVGCSFVIVKGPPPASEQTAPFTCTQRNTGPILDVVAAGLSGVLTVVAATKWREPDSYYFYASDELTYAGAASGTLFALSAVAGFLKTRKCRDAVQRFQSQGVDLPPTGTASPTLGPAVPVGMRFELPGARGVSFRKEAGAAADQLPTRGNDDCLSRARRPQLKREAVRVCC